MRHPLPTLHEFLTGIKSRDRVALARAITLVESAKPEHAALAQDIIRHLLEDAPATPAATLRMAVTGAPGVGKSTFIEALGQELLASGHRVAVLAIDPSSAVSKGSILGDKTRMEKLSTHENAFVRPSPSGESLGGVARKTRETIFLVEAAGYDVVLVETVGVGQSEIAAHGMTDLFLLLLLPGAGDELQGIKRGIVEMADLVVVNKADGDRVQLANQARAHYANATHLLPPKPSGWTPRVLTCSALEHTGIAELWHIILAFREQALKNGFLLENRKNQAQYWLKEALLDGLQSAFYKDPAVKAQLGQLQSKVTAGQISPFAAARSILDTFFKTL